MRNIGLLVSLWLGSAVAAQNKYSVSSSQGEPAPEVLAAGNGGISFRVEGWNGSRCEGDEYQDFTVANGSAGRCFNTNGEVGSLGVATEGSCPDGHVQISYWEEADCSAGKWHGYDYTSRNSHCHRPPSDGRRFQSVLLRCQALEVVEQDGVKHRKRALESQDHKARFNIINHSSQSQEVYIMGSAKGRQVVVKQDGSLVETPTKLGAASVAIHLDRNQQVSIDIERPFLQGRLYAAERDPGFDLRRSGKGWPNCPSLAAGSKCNLMSFEVYGAKDTNKMSAGRDNKNGMPQFGVEIKGGSGIAKSGEEMRWADGMTVTLQ